MLKLHSLDFAVDSLCVFQGTDGDSCFTVKPEELILKAGEEKGVVVSFTAQDTQKFRERHVHSYRLI